MESERASRLAESDEKLESLRTDVENLQGEIVSMNESNDQQLSQLESKDGEISSV